MARRIFPGVEATQGAIRRAVKRGRANANEASILLNIASQTVRNRCEAGELPCVKVGNSWYIDNAELVKLGAALPLPPPTSDEDYYDDGF